MAGDLHTHTNFSDGSYSPEELVAAAKKIGTDMMRCSIEPATSNSAMYSLFRPVIDRLVMLDQLEPQCFDCRAVRYHGDGFVHGCDVADQLAVICLNM